MLTLLNKRFSLSLTLPQLESYAAQLGSDCPFFIQNQSTLATGRGTSLAPFAINLAGHHLALLFPQCISVPRQPMPASHPHKTGHHSTKYWPGPVSQWKDSLVNDFETSVFPTHPLLPQLKDHLYTSGAIYAALTGSGAALFGIFAQKPRNWSPGVHHQWWKL